MLLTAARALALAIAHMDAEARRSGREPMETRAQLHHRAVQLLRKAVQVQPANRRAAFWDKFVRLEPDLKAVRGSLAYAELDREYLAPRK
jgi:hypothetical protein